VGTFEPVRRLKSVVFPLFGRPTSPIFMKRLCHRRSWTPVSSC
jgi:hypothetical protein